VKKLLKGYVESFKFIRVLFSKLAFNGEGRFFLVSGNSRVPLQTIHFRDVGDSFEYDLQYDVDLSKNDYYLETDHGIRCDLIFRNFVKDPFFDIKYGYEENDLGPIYQKERTTIKVWSPVAQKIILEIIFQGTTDYLLMEKGQNGVHTIVLEGDYEGAEYLYLVHVNGRLTPTTDPYAFASTANHLKSVIIDPNKTKVELFEPTSLNKPTDHIIYELHVRDFSSDFGAPFINKGMYKAFTEKGLKTKDGKTCGLDYLQELGVTSIQLSPITDFGSVDENMPLASYNWGYDPVQYNVCEGSYTTSINNPYARIIECKEMIESIHSIGLNVILDVVFNHMFDARRSPFEILVPHYFFREDEYGNPSNGSFCSNDFDSTKAMSRKYILDMLTRWLSFYNVDGFRFDLMGITDIKTINKVYELGKSLKQNFIMYGEGWNMPTDLEDSRKATQQNNAKMPGVGFFNDRFRDAIRGRNDDDSKGIFTDGFVNFELLHDVLTGCVLTSSFGYKYLSANNVVNYVECHDNLTILDKLERSLPYDTFEEKLKRLSMMQAIVILSPGIPFLHAGQEFFLTKNGDHNSFISGDKVNHLSWNRRDTYDKNIQFVKRLISIRKELPILKLNTPNEIKNAIKVTYDNRILTVFFKDANADFVCIYNLGYDLYHVVLDVNCEYKMLLDSNYNYDQAVRENFYLEPLTFAIIKPESKN
jgi:pullulanase